MTQSPITQSPVAPEATASAERVLTGARLVTPDRVMEGTLLIRDGRIADISPGRSHAADAVDCEGDFLIPGLVELHTDTLERHLQPRPGVDWPRRAAAAAHDAEFATQGVTTIFDAVRVGVLADYGVGDYAVEAIAAMDALRDLGLLRADHFIHVRCEICAPTALSEFDALGANPRIRLISLMDHTIGQRQFRDVAKFREYYLGKKGFSEQELQIFQEESRGYQRAYAGPNRAALAARARAIEAAGGVCVVAGHDDGARSDVAESLEAGAQIAEFPTTLEAARLSRQAGLKILMGAPNLLRGLSHSGNVSAIDLAREGLVDILSSDYAPSSLLLAAFKLAEETDHSLPAALAMVTATPAEAVRLPDRGALTPGLRADLARVYRAERLCATRGVWREGVRVC
ncbi:MAG: alpha-D-ribose 1-methylphosphonate 5-triphosphate diphosphatase [Pseudomonadota bacterium]